MTPIAIYYIIALLVAVGVFFTGNIINKKNKDFTSKLLKIFSLCFAFVFLCRYMLGTDAIQNMFALSGAELEDGAQSAIAILLVWFTYAGNILLCLNGFFDIKRKTTFIKFISFPISILNLCFLSLHFSAILGTSALEEISVRSIFFAVELGFAFAYSLYVFITTTDWKTTKTVLLQKLKKQQKYIEKTQKNIEKTAKNQVFSIKTVENDNKKHNSFIVFWLNVGVFFKKIGIAIGHFFKKYWFDIFVVLVVFLSVMPSYVFQGLFGDFHQIHKTKDLEFPHRLILYIALILPIIIHYTLKNKSYNEKKFWLLYICLGTLLTFSLNHRFDSFLDPTRWPLHLCNTAMYIMPIVLIFNMRKFFYFTYFINVLGAFFAMLMPNYNPATLNVFSGQLINFYVNHYIAFFMPLLFVSLGMFKRPRLAQFIYSFIGFAVYFIFVVIINAVFTGMYNAGFVSETTDFFFVNSDFIADKLGSWAERLRDVTAQIDIGGITLTFYPVYQILFFISYVLLGLAVWFVYEQAYAIAESLADIKARKEKIKIDHIALLSQLNGRSEKEPMQPENSNKLILNNFSKRYGNSDVYAVKDANLEVCGGKIFGFLGPNGAGKSTIIKTVVGIQPITSGQILVCGYDVDKQPVEAKRQIGFVPDHYALYEKLTGREYINYIADLYNVPLKERNERIDSYVKRFELEQAFDNQMKTYSHGMKQKIAIMSALVHNPKVWILDEPLTGLDPNSIFQVKECMKEHARKGNIVFFSSHIIDVVEKICDKIAIIKKGNILLSKSVAEIEATDTLENFYMRTINGDAYATKFENDDLNVDKPNLEQNFEMQKENIENQEKQSEEELKVENKTTAKDKTPKKVNSQTKSEKGKK